MSDQPNRDDVVVRLDISDRRPRVVGHCPMGCGETLALTRAGHVTCRSLGCPGPGAVDLLLTRDARERDHIVTFDSLGYTVQHPLRERIEGTMETCGLHAALRALDGPPDFASAASAGRFRAAVRDQRDSGGNTITQTVVGETGDLEVRWGFWPVEHGSEPLGGWREGEQ